MWVSPAEAEAIAEQLKIPLEDFIKKYTRRIGNRLSLTERRNNGQYDCVFLDGKRCNIYENRPAQCRSYPWWPENLESAEAWRQEAKRCEGIDAPESPLISLEQIKKHL